MYRKFIMVSTLALSSAAFADELSDMHSICERHKVGVSGVVRYEPNYQQYCEAIEAQINDYLKNRRITNEAYDKELKAIGDFVRNSQSK